ncbi:hypothetical protein C2S53_002475 [Perilla frutescens var. hirtella]|uniref:BZIP domain-containing protein n=1 Tax=Perilla frutescens var. hirtella TaxID=608512 RepID=A0AAD4IP44_PERFH|nr:hypothetical protein C2S53_002475 [Perilla frutescens var. hirtella]
MGNIDEEKPSKPEKPSSPPKEQSTNHVYPDWAMMQAYYGPQFTVPPYLNSAVASPNIPPPYMWVPPQYMIPHYGASYPVFYSHEGVYGHSGVSMAGTSFSMDTPAESSGNTDGRVMKKSKDLQGLAVSMGNENADSGEHGTNRRLSESEETDDSSGGSNGVTAEAGQSGTKRCRAGSSKSAAKDDKDKKKGSAKVGRGYESIIEMSCPANTPAKTVENTSTVPKLKDPSVLNVKPIATYDPQTPISNEAWLENEQELKREKRKLSNRESARRSRLRRQAESEELATKVETLTIENMTLKSEMDKFMEICKKLELENATLMEKLNDARPGEVNSHKIDCVRQKPVDTVNLLARVISNGDGSTCTDRTNEDEDGDSYENRRPVATLHQLLDAIASPRKDLVAAG